MIDSNKQVSRYTQDKKDKTRHDTDDKNKSNQSNQSIPDLEEVKGEKRNTFPVPTPHKFVLSNACFNQSINQTDRPHLPNPQSDPMLITFIVAKPFIPSYPNARNHFKSKSKSQPNPTPPYIASICPTPPPSLPIELLLDDAAPYSTSSTLPF